MGTEIPSNLAFFVFYFWTELILNPLQDEGHGSRTQLIKSRGRVSWIRDMCVNSRKDECHESMTTLDCSKKQVQDRRLPLDSTSTRGRDKS